jgi:hypothetical protein
MVNDEFYNQEHIQKRIKLAYTNIGSLYSAGVLNKSMSIQTKLSLFKIYIKPLLYYGCESLDLNKKDVNDIRKCEGGIVKSLVGISKYCHTDPLFSALDIENTEESIYINKIRAFT